MLDNFRFPKDVKGWLSPSEGTVLFDLAQRNPDLGKIVELGAFHGKSTICLAQGSKKVGGGKVFSVDTFYWGTYLKEPKNFLDSFQRNVRKYSLEDQVEPVISESGSAGDRWFGGSIRLLFIDADHSYKAVKRDFAVWERFIPVGGIIAFHDSLSWPGVVRFVFDLIASGKYQILGTCYSLGGGGLTYFCKAAAPTSYAERLSEALKLSFLQLISFNVKVIPVAVALSRRIQSLVGGKKHE